MTMCRPRGLLHRVPEHRFCCFCTAHHHFFIAPCSTPCDTLSMLLLWRHLWVTSPHVGMSCECYSKQERWVILLTNFFPNLFPSVWPPQRMSAPHVWASVIKSHRGAYSKGGQVLCTCSVLCEIESVSFCRHSHRIFARVNILCRGSYDACNNDAPCAYLVVWVVLLGVDQNRFGVFVVHNHHQLPRQWKPPFFCYPLRHICTPWVMFVSSDMYECTRLAKLGGQNATSQITSTQLPTTCSMCIVHMSITTPMLLTAGCVIGYTHQKCKKIVQLCPLPKLPQRCPCWRPVYIACTTHVWSICTRWRFVNCLLGIQRGRGVSPWLLRYNGLRWIKTALL